MSYAFAGLCVVVLLVASALLLLLAQPTENPNWKPYLRACAEAGGHIYQPDVIGFCITEDGRFVEVYP